ncbi:unnamed protein product [Cylicocyclus nassatus]|uniref:Uncharacterized protein n=1 Tax=Cylicocyclus nassatus TaxID=53992 RepID=A0AA36GMZ3_CYLNA|nr:unnamed protein product [Cylicocyclus nassatus]
MMRFVKFMLIFIVLLCEMASSEAGLAHDFGEFIGNTGCYWACIGKGWGGGSNNARGTCVCHS